MISDLLLPLGGFVVAAGILTITPGVDTAMVLRNAASGGARSGAGAAIGICVGLLVWGLSAAFGLTALLSASQLAFDLVKWAGAAYLVYLGAKLLMKPRARLDELDADEPARRTGAVQALQRGFLTNVLNPKVGLFYVTFLPQFIPQDASLAGWSLLLAGVHVVLTSLWFTVLIMLTVPLGRFLARPAVLRALDRLTGCVFVGFGAKLALAQRG